MSREMLPAEVEAFRRVRGVEPLAIKVAIDAVAVFVHPANPMGSLSLAQLDAIYSAERRCDGAAEAVRTWGQVGAGGPWAEQAIMAYGHRARSGTRMVFRRVALCGGPFHDDVHEHPRCARRSATSRGPSAART